MTLKLDRDGFIRTARKVIREMEAAKLECLQMMRLSALDGLDEKGLHVIGRYLKEVHLPAHATLCQKGEPATGLYIIADGECKCLDSGPKSDAAATKGPGQASAAPPVKVRRGVRDAGAGKPGAESSSALPKPPRRTKKAPPRNMHTTRGVQIAALGAGQIIGDMEMHSGHNTWQNSYVTTGAFRGYFIETLNFERYFSKEAQQQIKDEFLLKQEWRTTRQEPTQPLPPPPKAKAAKGATPRRLKVGDSKPAAPPPEPEPEQALVGRFGGSQILLPEPEMLMGLGEYFLRDDYAPSPSHEGGGGLGIGQMDSAGARPSSRRAAKRPVYTADRLSTGRSDEPVDEIEGPPPCSSFPSVSYAMLREGSSALTAGGSPRAPWGGARSARRCPIFLEKPEEEGEGRVTVPRCPGAAPALPTLMPQSASSCRKSNAARRAVVL